MLYAMLVAVVLILGVLSPTGGAYASDANTLFVEAVKLIKKSEKAEGDRERYRLLGVALGNFDRIVNEYPESELAVKLITDQPIGTINVPELRTIYDRLAINIRAADEAAQEIQAWAHCKRDLTADCLRAEALRLARDAGQPERREQILALIAFADLNARNFAATRSVISGVTDGLLRRELLREYSKAAVKAEKLDTIYELAKQLVKHGNDIDEIVLIVFELAQNDRLDELY